MIELFYDKELTKKIPKTKINKEEKFKIDLGEIEAGVENVKKIYAFNPGPGILANLEFSSGDKQIKISGPIGLEENESAEIEIRITPPVAVEKGLKASLRIEGKLIYKPP